MGGGERGRGRVTEDFTTIILGTGANQDPNPANAVSVEPWADQNFSNDFFSGKRQHIFENQNFHENF